MWKVAVLVLWFAWLFPAVQPVQPSPELVVLNRKGETTSAITDGDLVQLRLKINPGVSQDTAVTFLAGRSRVPVATCTIPGGALECTTASFRAFGWFWMDGPGPTSLDRTLAAALGDQELAVRAAVTVKPRPVVMVHGFVSDYTGWLNYLGPQGYLSGAALPGFAVGDGQADGVMKTGSIIRPAESTNTIAQNAAILAGYIGGVKAQTGAETVDLLGHSMGGLISRFYIDQLMEERDVAQLIMLGTPSAGSDCAILPGALGFYFPTVLEIRSAYITGVFNQQIHRRQGVPFFALAGTVVTSPVGSPCTAIPNDMVVSRDSVTSIGLNHQEIPILHINLNTSAEAFQNFVLPLLQRLPSESWTEPDPPLPSSVSGSQQFTRVLTGHVDQGGSAEQTINLEDGLAVASFALYDPSRTLAVQVTGASGRVIDLTAGQNGLLLIDDPATLVTMGYGFDRPNPGPWKIKLSATNQTPAGGSDYSLTAHLVGGAELSASAQPLLPASGSPVHLQASLTLSGVPLDIQNAEAFIRGPNGFSQTVPLSVNNNQAQADWQPGSPGFYALDLLVSGRLADGTAIERTAYLTVEAQPATQGLPINSIRIALLLAISCLAVILLGLVLFLIFRRKPA